MLHLTKQRKHLLANQYLVIGPDILLINAHGNKDDDRIKVFSYQFYQLKRSERRHDGVVIGVRGDIPHTVTQDLLSETLAVTLEPSQGRVIIAT